MGDPPPATADPMPTPSLGRGFGSSVLPLAAMFDVALLDLDGVVYVGQAAVPHAASSLDAARMQFGMRAAFVTNNAARPPEVVAEHLRELGINALADDVVTSAQAGARVLAERVPAGAKVLAVGGPGVAWALRERALVPVGSADEDPVAVMQGYGPGVGWQDLAEACLVIERGGVWVATNLDRTIPSPRGRVLGNGSLVAALRHATGADPVAAGKPEPPLMLESVHRTGAQRPLVVGDRLDTDIEGAARVGLPSLLVLTGVTGWWELIGAPPEHRPTYLDHDLRGLLRPAPEVTVDAAGGWIEAQCGAARARVPIGDRETPAPGAGVEDRHEHWWIPQGLRPGTSPPPREPSGGGARGPDLEAVRALVAAAWAAADQGVRITGEALVDRRH